MYTINATNVNDAYNKGMNLVRSEGWVEPSRNGNVFVMDAPVMTVTDRPDQRVLLDPGRKANHFFHFFECIWMMSGRRDAGYLDRFISDFGARFAEDDGDVHGAYGHRWRNFFGFDQLETALDMLRGDSTTRRVVISMWDPDADLGSDVRDMPCNTHLYPRILNGALDLTVCCRSNDVVWGAHGANAVHFSFLQQWMAEMLGLRTGTLYQLSNNYHLYESVAERYGTERSTDPYKDWDLISQPIVQDPDNWEIDLRRFTDNPSSEDQDYSNVFFDRVAVPMWNCHAALKAEDVALAEEHVRKILADDWREAAHDMIQRKS